MLIIEFTDICNFMFVCSVVVLDAMKKKRFTTLGVGITGKWALSWAFDFILYPFILALFGFFGGTVIMTILSFIVSYGLILFYDRTKKDWLGIETLKEIEDFIPRQIPECGISKYWTSIINLVGESSAWLMKKSDTFLLVVLSIKFDPFITVIQIRHGAHQYNGLSKRDWKIFITSVIIGNLYWAIAVFMGITLAEALWKLFLTIA